jgi:predicted hydrocarbon binding protein
MINEPLITRQREGEAKSSVILLRRECFEKMLTNLTETYGAPGYSMIFSMGKNTGESEFRSMAEEQNKLGIPMTRPKILKNVLDRLTSMGWGRFQAESLELNASAVVVVNNNIFSDRCSHDSMGCCFIQGIIAGLMSEVFESEPIYGEPRCLAQPGGRCVFRLSSEKAQNKLIEPATLPSST